MIWYVWGKRKGDSLKSWEAISCENESSLDIHTYLFLQNLFRNSTHSLTLSPDYPSWWVLIHSLCHQNFHIWELGPAVIGTSTNPGKQTKNKLILEKQIQYDYRRNLFLNIKLTIYFHLPCISSATSGRLWGYLTSFGSSSVKWM